MREWLEKWAPKCFGRPRIILDREGGQPYLSRFYIFGKPRMDDGKGPFESDGAPKQGARWGKSWGLFLHRFHKGDDDLELHNHPWAWAVSLILVGGYREERRVEGVRGILDHEVETRDYRPGSWNVIDQDTFHRVDLFQKDAWTLFLVGPKVANWGFWSRYSGRFQPWRAHIAQKRARYERDLS